MDPCVDLPLEPKALKDVVEKAKDFCLMHGKSNWFLTYVLFNLSYLVGYAPFCMWKKMSSFIS